MKRRTTTIHASSGADYANAENDIILSLEDFAYSGFQGGRYCAPDHAAELVAYDTMTGEFRVHYAGFFDPGFGLKQAGGMGSRAV
ncbi:MAG: 2'-deoxycytidine 5'-triphosphate deaminase [Rhodospirillaceae bacterium]|nr:2'-deoxycytidine 5'-triphosphate deaminase [Rhodospirillaceae bacterium]